MLRRLFCRATGQFVRRFRSRPFFDGIKFKIMELLTVDELAELLRLSRTRIVLMARHGDLPALLLAGRFRFDVIEIEDWVKQNRVKPGSS